MVNQQPSSTEADPPVHCSICGGRGLIKITWGESNPDESLSYGNNIYTIDYHSRDETCETCAGTGVIARSLSTFLSADSEWKTRKGELDHKVSLSALMVFLVPLFTSGILYVVLDGLYRANGQKLNQFEELDIYRHQLLTVFWAGICVSALACLIFMFIAKMGRRRHGAQRPALNAQSVISS